MGRLLSLFLHLLAVRALYVPSSSELLSDVGTVCAEEEPLYGGEDGRVRTCLLLLEMAGRESGGKRGAVGKAGDCGRVQLVFPGAKDGHSCAEFGEGDLDLRLGLRWLRRMRDVCGGSVERGLAAYARGSCKSEEGLSIARRRIRESEKYGVDYGSEP